MSIAANFLIAWLAAAAAASDAGAQLAEASRLFDEAEFGKVIPLVERVLAVDNLDAALEQRAHLLEAQCQAILGLTSDAEQSFRLVFRLDPGFELGPETPPKILAVWRKVQTDEQALLRQLAALQRQRLIDGLGLDGGPPVEPVGGRPLVFRYRLRDPTAAVAELAVAYRRQGGAAFSELALERSPDGEWRGALPGEWSVNDDGFTLEYFVETRDPAGPLLVAGSSAVPAALLVAPGDLPLAQPVPAWALWSTAAVAVAAGLAGGAFAILAGAENDSYRALQQADGAIDGAQLMRHRRTGDTWALSANVLFGVGGALGLAAGVMFPFTDLDGPDAD